MEPFRRKIENIQSPRSIKYFYVLGIFYMLIGVATLYKESIDMWNSIIWIFSGLGFTISGLVEKKKNKTFYIEFNNFGIEAKLSYFTSLNIKWDDIEQIKIKPISVMFQLKNGEIKKLNFDNLSYKSVIEMKEKLKIFIEVKGITCS